MLSRLLNLIWLSLKYRGPKVDIISTRTEPGPGHTHSANSCAVPCFAGKPGMYQQSSFLVITFTLSGMSLGRHRSFAVMPRYGALVNNLIVTTDRFVMGSPTGPSSRSSSQGTKPRTAPVPLAWSVALRASRDIFIQASIEYVVSLSTLISFICLILRIGRSREFINLTDERILIKVIALEYWRSLLSSLDFADQPLKSCVNVIHVDIIEIWNLFDRHRVSSP